MGNQTDILSEIQKVLSDALVELTGEAKAEFAAYVAEISVEIQKQALAAAAGDPVAARNLKHLKAQAIARASILEIGLETRSIEAIGEIVLVLVNAASRWLMPLMAA